MPPKEIEYNGSFDIATGRSRRETSWRNKEMTWADLLEKLAATHRTAETHSEYLASKKVRQDEIKDIGGFVGGYISGGRRKAGSVLHRQLVTLDIDFATMDAWDDFAMLYASAAALYSTHKHSTDSPRFRLIIPLDRPVFSDEYMAIARRIAGVLGIDAFDHTTFQPERLMYWPSTSKDGEYVFEQQDGPWLSADSVLASYHNWKDSSEWPVSSREGTIIQSKIKKQGDPLEKPGVVGAFCRTYTVDEAIEEYLQDVYEPGDIEGRYTYKEGSTAGGLVVYEDKYVYSHHGTDPVSGKLCNVFDLVRLHKFGLKDEDAREDTPSNKLPSYLAMLDLSVKDVRVKKQINNEKLGDAQADFDDPEDMPEEVNDDWALELDVDRKSNYLSTMHNVALILNNDPSLKGRIGFNGFTQRRVVLRNLPWRHMTEESKYWKDEDEANLRIFLEKKYNITGRPNIKDALDAHFIANEFHPIKDYLKTLHWDGESRLDTLLIDYLGAEDTDYIRAITRKTFTAAVARVYQPGIKFDYVLTLIGKQGIGKSSLIDRLGKEWYSDSFGNLQTKEAVESIQGVWIMEIGELAGLKKAEVDTIKHFISKREDSYRVAYGRNMSTFRRQCIFIGTTNNKVPLRDSTGGRRFWIADTTTGVASKNVFTDLSDYEIDQVWAEALEFYKKREPLFLSAELEATASEKQEEHTEKDDRVGAIKKYLETLVPDNWDELSIWDRRSFLQGEDELQGKGVVLRDKICVAEIWCELLGGTSKDMTTFNTKDLHSIMQNMEGWVRTKGSRRFKIYGEQRAYNRAKNGGLPANTEKKSVFAVEN